MSIKQLSQSNILKSAFFVLFAVSTLFLGGTKAEAAGVTWGIWYEACFGYNSTAITGGWMDDGFGNLQYITYPEPLFSTTFGNLTLAELSSYFQQYPINKPGTVYSYEIMTSDGVVPGSFPSSACKMYESTQYFAANTAKEVDTYTPGEPITVFLGAQASGGFEFGGWSGLTTSLLWNPITGPISCFLFGGCDDPPYVGLQALSQGQTVAGWCGSAGSTSCSGTFNAPTTPGNYSIHLDGCYVNCPPAAPVGMAEIPFTVVSSAINGSCGTSHYVCSTGTSANNVSTASSYTWSCTGSSGGTTASCSEARPVCGTASGKTYPYAASSYGSDTLCSVGSTDLYGPVDFPPAGGSRSWLCTVDGNTWSGMCQAWRSASPASPTVDIRFSSTP